MLYSVFIFFLSACTRRHFFVKEKSREAQRAKGGSSRVFVVCINIGELDVSKDLFLMLYFGYVIVRRTNSSYNKRYIFSAGEGTVESQIG